MSKAHGIPTPTLVQDINYRLILDDNVLFNKIRHAREADGLLYLEEESLPILSTFVTFQEKIRHVREADGLGYPKKESCYDLVEDIHKKI